MDNRFPNLLELTLLPGSPAETARLRAQINEVCRRTGAKCLYNVVPKRLHFYRTDPAIGIPIAGSDTDAGIPDRMIRIRSDAPTQLDVNRLVAIIGEHFRLAAMPKGQVDAARRAAEASAESDAAAAQQRELDDRRPEAMAYLKRKGNRFGMGRHFRPVVTVDGFKSRDSGLLVPQGG